MYLFFQLFNNYHIQCKYKTFLQYFKFIICDKKFSHIIWLFLLVEKPCSKQAIGAIPNLSCSKAMKFYMWEFGYWVDLLMSLHDLRHHSLFFKIKIFSQATYSLMAIVFPSLHYLCQKSLITFLIFNFCKIMSRNGMKEFISKVWSQSSIINIFKSTWSNEDFSNKNTHVYMNYVINLRHTVYSKMNISVTQKLVFSNVIAYFNLMIF